MFRIYLFSILNNRNQEKIRKKEKKRYYFCTNLIVSCNPVLQAIWLGHQWLKLFQDFLVRRVANHWARLKTRPIKAQMNILIGVNNCLGQWGRLGSIAMEAVSAVMTATLRDSSTEFNSQGKRSLPMVSKYTRLKWTLS